MPRNVNRGRAAPDGGDTAAIAGVGWFVGYGMVTPFLRSRSGAALVASRWLRRLGCGTEDAPLSNVLSVEPTGSARHPRADAYGSSPCYAVVRGAVTQIGILA